MANQITGKVEMVGSTVNLPKKNGNGFFSKREIVLDVTRYDQFTGERGFDNYVKLEFSGDKCSELDNVKVGDIATISFDLQGGKYTKNDGSVQYITSVRGFKIEVKNKPIAEKPAIDKYPFADKDPFSDNSLW